MGYYDASGQYILDPGEADQLRAQSAAHANDVPDVPQSDLALMVNWTIPSQTDENGRTYQTSYTGQRLYLNDGSTPTPINTFMHSYQWDPTTGTYKASLNSGGILGAVEGAGALAAPLVGGPALAGAFGGTSAAAGGTVAGDGVLPSSAIGGYAAPAAVTSSGVGDAAAALLPSSALGGYSLPAAVTSSGTGAATGGSMSFLDALFPDLIKGGSSIIGALIGTHGNTEAAKIAAQSAQQALDFEKAQYAAKQQALSPYANVGSGAIGALGSAYGLTSAAPAGTARPVLMRAPNGITKVVSSADAAHYQQLGATLLGDA